MDATELKTRIKQHVSRVTGIRPEDIQDSSLYVKDLGLDSLALLELTVDLEFAFKIKIPEERLPDLRTVEETARVVREFQAGQAA